MIQYKNGRLHIPGISFAIPEGFYFCSDVDCVADNYLQFVSPDGRYRLSFLASSSLCGNGKKDLELMIQETGGQAWREPTPLSVNGLKGHYAVYGEEGEVCFELRIENPYGKDGYEQLILLIMCETVQEIKRIMCTKEVRDTVNSIQTEQRSAKID